MLVHIISIVPAAAALHFQSQVQISKIYRGSYMSAHASLNLLNELRKKEIKCEVCLAFYLFFATTLINSIIQEHEC